MLEYRARLRDTGNADGGWGSTPGSPSTTEATALALMAATPDPELREWKERAARWLIDRQTRDGWWPANDTVPDPSWATLVAILALQNLPNARAAVRAGMDWTVATAGIGVPWRIRLKEWLAGEQQVELNANLAGWPWTPDTFSWVEPTSYGLLVLKRSGDRSRSSKARIAEAEAMMLDRACPGGGWNYGNKRVLGVDLDPFPDTTALALLALHGLDDPRIEAGLTALEALVDSRSSGLTLALSLLCQRAYGRGVPDLPKWLERRHAETGSLWDTRTLALAAMATSDHPNPFVSHDHSQGRVRRA